MKFLISLLLVGLSATSIIAENGPLSPEMDKLRAEGFEILFNMNYQEAREKFQEMIALEPRNPAGYVYLANAIWLNYLASLRRLQSNVYNKGNAFYRDAKNAEVDPAVDTAFRENINKAMLHAEAELAANKNNVAALYYLGLARNISAGYEATVKRSFFSALRNGSKGVALHRQVLKKDPNFTDAALSVGMYEYITGSLPWGVKILAFLGGVHGSKKNGLLILDKVYREGNYARDEAATLLLMLYNREKRFEDCLKLVTELSTKYPDNFFFALEKASTLSQLKRYEESNREFDSLLQNPDAMQYMADLIHYQYAESLSQAGSWEKAYDEYMAAAQSTTAPESLVTIAYLEAGQCLDAIGKRDEAKEKYELVLKRRDFMDSRDLAKKYLRKPYRPPKDDD
jgi:tetratricopeptide (TPR) repeat protein